METPQAYIARMLGYVGNDDPWTILRESPERLSTLVSSVDAAARAKRPAPDRWSIDEIAAHMADVEIVSAYRLRMILSTNGTPIQAFDQDAWARTFKYDQCDALESARLFSACREATLRLLDRVDPALYDNHGMHAERGVETVKHLIRLYAGHDRNHLQQIQRIVEAA